MKYIKLLSILALGFLLEAGHAQDVLSKDAAVQMILEQNFDVLRAANVTRIAENNTDKGAIGYNPVVNASAAGSINYGSSFQQFSNGDEIKSSNASTVAGNAGVIMSYNFYEGGRRDITLDQLLETVKLTELQKRQQVEFSILEMLLSYYQVANLTNTVSSLNQTQEVSRRRLTRARFSFDYGQGNKLQVLNAEVDMNRDSVNLRDAEQQLANSKRDVNILLARDVTTQFEVDTALSYTQNMDIDRLLTGALDSNTQVLLARMNLILFDYDKQLIETTKRPVFGADVSMNANFSKNLTPSSFIDFSSRWGPTAGIGMSWNLWDGGTRRVQRDNNRIQIENQQLTIDQISQQLERDIRNAWQVYENAMFVLDIERHNLRTNEDNFNRTQEQFNIGQVTSVEFRQAQFNMVNAQINLSTARYTAKVAELRVLQLSGMILDADF
jgi:outer membrane protein TolC